MGGSDEAVCDPQVRVRGLDGLRVVDASAMPAVPRGNTNAPTIAVAERAADLIRGDTLLGPADLEAEPATVPSGASAYDGPDPASLWYSTGERP